MTRFMGYKYTINPSSQRFTISSFLLFSVYIFSEFISLKYHYILSLYKITDFTIRESLYLYKKNFLQVTTIDHMASQAITYY
jgi:hypothetical protein